MNTDKDNNIKKLIEKRGFVKAALTRIVTAVDRFDQTADNINQLKVRLPNLHSLYQQFDTIQSELELLDSTRSDQDREEFEIKYYDVESKILTIIQDIENRSSSTTSSISEPTGNTSLHSTRNVRLPQLNLPSFEGNYIHWTAFHDTFNSLIHESTVYSDIEKFHYLRSCLKGDAFKTIEGVTISELNYQLAWDTLKKRFKNSRLIIQEHVFKIINSPQIQKASHVVMRQLLDDVSINLEALKSLKQPVDQWDSIIIPIIVQKFDFQTKKEWEGTLNTEPPKIEDLKAFLHKKCLLLESLSASNKQNIPIKPNQTYKNNSNVSHKDQTTNLLSTNSKFKCPLCSNEHMLYRCKEFLRLSVPDRIDKLKALQLCLNCFRSNHKAPECKSSSCKLCNQKHNTYIHKEASSTSAHIHNKTPAINQGLLCTAEILVKNQSGIWHKIRALLDVGSQSNLITRTVCNELGLTLRPTNISVCGVNNAISDSNYSTEIVFKSQYNSNIHNISCLVIPRITDNLPTMSFEKEYMSIPSNLHLADTNFHESGKVDILLGAGIFWALLRDGRIPASRQAPHFQETELGWIVGGDMPLLQTRNKTNCSLSTIDSQIAKFWEIEECNNNHTASKFSAEESNCIEHFKNSYKRDYHGRFIVRLPFKDNLEELGNSKNMAMHRFYSLERKLMRDNVLRTDYSKFINEYVELDHMQSIGNTNGDSTNQSINILPHHAVHKELSTTTKLRVVFDASAKTSSGLSLNDTLMVGPKLQEDLFTIMIRFRTYQYVITADINKMFRQILVNPEDRKYQCVLWRNNNADEIKLFQLNTVTYGTACAPFLAVQCLHQLAEEEGVNFPVAAEVVRRDFYMDDLITGTNTVNEALQLRNDLQTMLSRGGFQLRKWASNNPCLLPDAHQSEHMINFEGDGKTKLLGLWWNYNSDQLNYVINLATIETDVPLTKRSLLSKICQIFDPLGLLSPVIICAKLIIQQLWQIKHGWDNPVPTNLQITWVQLADQLKDINRLKIPRKVIEFHPVNSLQLHGFSDASEKAYGACIYVRSTDIHGQTYVHLMCAKSRVAPLKTQTIPRLELCAALLLSKLMKTIIDTLNIKIDKLFYWTDSKIVLAWQSSSPNKLKTFVANRVSEIQTLTKSENWHHVRSSDNPADLVSRGCNPEMLFHNTLWFHGPEWLQNNEKFWPITEQQIRVENLPEVRTVACKITIPEINWMLKYSNFSKLRRVVAYCLRFRHNCRKNVKRKTGSLSVCELQNATSKIASAVQKSSFKEDWRELNSGRKVSNKSKLENLNPFIDSDGLIRVGGRLRHANIEFNQKHPIVLPKHYITKLIIKSAHESHLHAGTAATLAAVRENYWPLSGRSQVRQVLYKCIPCFRAHPKSTHPIMGDLPAARIQYSRPFTNCGVDYAGPMFIKENTGRGKRKIKAYVCLFICFTTKAIHLELVHSLTTEAFLNALKRFIGRRGMIENIYSDNATNFIGAQRELMSLKELFQSQQFQENVVEVLCEQNITWNFIPPRSPNFGGLWEAGVKRVKFHLKRVVGDALLTYEEMYTYLVCIEACLNSRPLCPLSNDPNDLAALTPGHFLVGSAMTAPYEPSLHQLKQNRLSRYQHVERLRQHFWIRWSREYLGQLQPRPADKSADATPIQPGALIIVKDSNTPPLSWKYGRIVEVHPGTDGIVRVVSVKTSQGVVKRAVRNICVVPLDNNKCVIDKD